MRLVREIDDGYNINKPNDAYRYLKEFKDEDREFFVVLGLDSKNKVLYRDVVSVGTLNSALIHPREVFKSAIMRSSNSLIIAHNHPSGDKDASYEDREILDKLLDASKVLNIKILDALIITKDGLSTYMN